MAKDLRFSVVLLWLLVGFSGYGQGNLKPHASTSLSDRASTGLDSARLPSLSKVRDRVIETALTQVGVREATGKNDGPHVEKYLKVVGLGKGYAWCAAYVSWVYKVNGVTRFKTAWAPGWFPKDRIIKGHETPEPGDLFGLWINNRIGHVGLVYVWGDKVVKTIEGNTNDAGSREGDGVYVKRRLRKQIYVSSRWILN